MFTIYHAIALVGIAALGCYIGYQVGEADGYHRGCGEVEDYYRRRRGGK